METLGITPYTFTPPINVEGVILVGVRVSMQKLILSKPAPAAFPSRGPAALSKPQGYRESTRSLHSLDTTP